MYKLSKLAAGSVIAATAAMGMASAALADGYSPKRVVYERPADWSGVYFGVGSGYQWSSVDVAGPGIGIKGDHGDGIVSAHVGAQHQFGAIVVGVEGGWMASLTDNEGNAERCDSVPPVLTNPIIAPGNFCRGKLNDVITAGGRLGFAAGRWMPYVAGGYANGGFDFNARVPGAVAGATTLTETAHTRLNGWYVGGGVEWTISPGWTAGIEYRHYEFEDDVTQAFNPANGTFRENVRFDATTDTVSARVSWRWGRPEVAPLK